MSERPDVSEIVIAYDVRDEVLTCLESVGQHAGDVSVEAGRCQRGFGPWGKSPTRVVDGATSMIPGVRQVAADVRHRCLGMMAGPVRGSNRKIG